MSRDLHDHFFHQAKRAGYRSRAAYKLIEIDDRKKVLSRGDKVLDCGAAPGSWLQVAADRVGRDGLVVGVDPVPMDQHFKQSNNYVIQSDIRDFDLNTLRRDVADISGSWPPFDVILSDMAPKTTGDRFRDHHQSVNLCREVLQRSPGWLKVGGNLVLKVFEGEAYPELLGQLNEMFDKAKGFKPKASRNESVEMYIIGTGFHGEAPVDASQHLPPKRKPAGWGK